MMSEKEFELLTQITRLTGLLYDNNVVKMLEINLQDIREERKLNDTGKSE